jgi:undecaprenyl-diphosphatase
MPLVLDLLLALVAGLLAWLAARWYARSTVTPERPAEAAARAVGRRVELRGLLARRLDRELASGFLLTLALLLTVGSGLVLGVLAVLVRRVAAIQHVDNAVARWGFDHRAAASTRGLRAVTELGNIQLAVVLAVLLALAAARLDRRSALWVAAFLVVVLGGMEVAQTGVKALVDRLRPTLDPAAARLGPSFPSGHSATAAAFYAAAVLVIGRHLRRPLRQLVLAAAIGIAVGVAASRVLLDLHWLSDVVGGLALGWGWFALAAVVFGGRLLRPTGAADVAAAAAEAETTGQRRAA